jgi:hypothetical protein
MPEAECREGRRRRGDDFLHASISIIAHGVSLALLLTPLHPSVRLASSLTTLNPDRNSWSASRQRYPAPRRRCSHARLLVVPPQ